MEKEIQNKEGQKKKALDFTINGQKHQSLEQYITGAEIRKIGGIPELEDIFLKVEKGWEDEQIQDDTRVDLARFEVEHFYSEPKHKQVTIWVAGEPRDWDKKKITFKEVIVLAYGEYIDRPTMIYTVAFEDGPKQNPEGSMVKGQAVFVKDKMIFHATATDKS